MNRTDLECLSKEELIDLVLRMQRPDKTSRTSSKPPSTDRKEKRENSTPGGAKPGHEGHSRKLCGAPDAFEDHAPTQCAGCGAAFGPEAERLLIGEYDEVELPPVRPFVRRHRRYAIRCTCCGKETKAMLPPAAVGTPFGPRIHALAIYMKTRQAVSYERLQRLFLDLFGLTLSQGALMNMFARTAAAFEEKRNTALAVLRAADVVASDETGVRIEGVNAYHWVFRCDRAVVRRSRLHPLRRGRAPDHERRAAEGVALRSLQRPAASCRQPAGLPRASRPRGRLRRRASEDEAPFRLKLWFNRVSLLPARSPTSRLRR